MAKKHAATAVEVVSVSIFNELLDELEKRPHVRLVKVDDQGLVEPARQGSAIVMQPRVRIVATALDHKDSRILRWEKKWDVGSGKVMINVFSGRGSYTDPTGQKTRDQITAALEARGLLVSEGEWTPETAEAALSGV